MVSLFSNVPFVINLNFVKEQLKGQSSLSATTTLLVNGVIEICEIWDVYFQYEIGYLLYTYVKERLPMG